MAGSKRKRRSILLHDRNLSFRIVFAVSYYQTEGIILIMIVYVLLVGLHLHWYPLSIHWPLPARISMI